MAEFTPRYPFLVTTDQYGDTAWAGVWAADANEAKDLYVAAVKASKYPFIAKWLDRPTPIRVTKDSPRYLLELFDWLTNGPRPPIVSYSPSPSPYSY